MGTSSVRNLDTRSFVRQSHVHGAHHGSCQRAETALEVGEFMHLLERFRLTLIIHSFVISVTNEWAHVYNAATKTATRPFMFHVQEKQSST